MVYVTKLTLKDLIKKVHFWERSRRQKISEISEWNQGEKQEVIVVSSTIPQQQPG